MTLDRRRWSKFRQKILNLVSEDIDFDLRCTRYQIKNSRSRRGMQRYTVLLNREIIWDYPGSINENTWDALLGFAELIQEYIDTPKEELLNKNFEKDISGITDILKAADRRIGKKSLVLLESAIKNPGALKIIDSRLCRNKNNLQA